MSATTWTWRGASGTSYTYNVYPIGTRFKNAPGNYIFAREVGTDYVPAYVGESGDLGLRHNGGGHEKIPCVRRHGATHIHVHINSAGDQARRVEEGDLIAAYAPPCNLQ